MRARLLLLVLCGLLAAAAAGAATIPVSGGESSLAVTGEGPRELAFRVQVGSLETLEVVTPAGTFSRLSIPGFPGSQTVGAPELPRLNRLVAVPLGARARVVVDRVVTRRLKLADAGVRHRILPAQPSLPKNVDPADWPFVVDEAAYATKTAGELVAVAPQGRLRAMDLARIEVAPVAYDPVLGELEVAETVEFRVLFEGGDPARARELKAVTASPFFAPVYARVAGDKGFHDGYPDRVADVVTMVIVTPPEFAAQLADFVAWKTERGFRTILAVTGTPEVGTTTTSIQAYLHGLYNDATVEEPAPSFVLFVGDVAQMPTFTVSGNATDRPYCAVDGDLVPDMYYGRLSATNATQLQAILDKTLMYDQFTMPDPSYLGSVTMIAGADATFGPTHGNGQINYGTEHYFDAAHGITSNTFLYPASASSESAIIASVSSGVGFINYTAHGSQTSWSDPTFTQTDVNGLTNSGKYCLAIGNCCLTGTYDYSECFGETWLRVADKGAIGYIGGSNNTLWNEDYWWGVGFHSSSQIDGTAWPYESTGLGAYDGLFHDHGEAMTQWYVTNDAIVFCGNLAVMESGSSNTTYYWNIYNLLGDPSLSTYLGVPAANPVSTTGISPAGVTVDAVPGSYVGFTQDGALIGAGTVGASGSAYVDFTTTPAGGVPVHMVVTAQNRIPYVEDLAVAAPAITLDATSYSESLETGGTLTRQLTVSNPGEPGSVLVFSVGVQAENPGVKGGADKSVAGSTMTVDEDSFYAGTTVDLVFTVFNASSDYEWLTDVSLDFPAGMSVNSATAFVGGSSPMPWNGETGDGALTTWHGVDSSNWGVIHGGESASATLSVTFAPSLTGSHDVAWTIQGDDYGSAPHSLSGTVTLTAAGPSITLTAPDGGEILPIDGSCDITWISAGGFTGPVRIELSRDGGGAWETLVAATDDDGLHPWTVTGPSSTDCLIRVGSGDGSVADASDGAFTIFQPVNWLAVDPAEGSVPEGGSALLDVDFDAAGMAPGTYQAYIVIGHNASPDPEVVPVTLVVTDPVSGVGDLPRVLALEGNHPNPFNPATTVEYAVPREGHVTLEILDLRGRVVRVLVDGRVPAGRHAAVWDGRDARGRSVASGLYLAHLRAGEREVTSKMTLAR
jgi:hypothetical protein